jgi:hypothetical protein
MADGLKASYSTILSHLRESLSMKSSHLLSISPQATKSSRRPRIETCRQLLALLEAYEESKFQRVVTDDESWFPLKFHHSAKCSVLRNMAIEKSNRDTNVHVDRHAGN